MRPAVLPLLPDSSQPSAGAVEAGLLLPGPSVFTQVLLQACTLCQIKVSSWACLAAGNAEAHTAALYAGDPGQLRRELLRRVRQRMDDRAQAGMAADPVSGWPPLPSFLPC